MKPTPRTVFEHARLAAGFELAAQVADEDVGDVRPGVERVAPDLLVQARAVEHLAGMAEEEMQQIELAPGEAEVAVAAPGRVRARVQRDVADRRHRLRRRWPPAQQRVQARGHLFEGERLDDVVVGARLEPADAVLDLVARGQDADGHVVAAVAQLAQDLEAVEVGHPEVEQDHRGSDGLRRGERGAPAGRPHDAEALELEPGSDGAPDRGVVVDEQDDRPVGVVVIHATRARSRGRRRRPGRRARGRGPARR